MKPNIAVTEGRWLLIPSHDLHSGYIYTLVQPLEENPFLVRLEWIIRRSFAAALLHVLRGAFTAGAAWHSGAFTVAFECSAAALHTVREDFCHVQASLLWIEYIS